MPYAAICLYSFVRPRPPHGKFKSLSATLEAILSHKIESQVFMSRSEPVPSTYAMSCPDAWYKCTNPTPRRVTVLSSLVVCAQYHIDQKSEKRPSNHIESLVGQ
jgi:hypothetical protein